MLTTCQEQCWQESVYPLSSQNSVFSYYFYWRVGAMECEWFSTYWILCLSLVANSSCLQCEVSSKMRKD